MNEFIECPNCGYVLNKSDKCCKYCGTKNPNYVEKPVVVNNQPAEQSSKIQTATIKTDAKISIPLFIVLLIFCWPVAIIYLILKSIK